METTQQHSAFKTVAFGGFHKQSVLSYVYELNNNAKAAQEQLNAQLQEVASSREQLQGRIRELEQKLRESESARQSTADELNAERARTSELGGMLDSLGAEIERQKQIVAQKDEEIRRCRRQLDELQSRNAEYEKKKQEVEKSSVYITELLMRAHTESDQILENAEQKAGEIVEGAYTSLSEVRAQFELFRGEMENIEIRIESAVVSMQKKFAAIGEAIDRAELVVDGSGVRPAADAENIPENFFREAAKQ